MILSILSLPSPTRGGQAAKILATEYYASRALAQFPVVISASRRGSNCNEKQYLVITAAAA